MGNISILLADDSITIQKVVGIIFAGDGYTLTVVDNGKSAVQKAQEIMPDVLLIDVLMPGMNGYEVCEAIRREPALSQKPILLLTGSFEPFDEAKAAQCGADAHIAKPFESQQIIAKVQELYELGQQRASGIQPAVAEPILAPEPPVAVEATSVFETTPAFEIESTPAFEPTSFDTNAFEPTAAAFEPTAAPAFEPAAAEPAAPAVSPDDPWGAFTQPPSEEPVIAPLTIEPGSSELPAVEPDVLNIVSEEPPMAVTSAADENIGASWVPVEEQTFEFREEVAVPPVEAVDAGMADELLDVAVEDQPVTAVEPAPAVSESAAVVAPVAAAGAVALTDEQLKQALMAASKETIERIVWEVVPDLAEALIKETIRRITEGK